MRANNVRVVLGSALLWAWGFLCFLSPALFPERGGLDASIGLEYGFFASQASVLVCAGVVVLVSRWRRFIVKRGAFFVAALLVALTTLVLTWAVRADALAVIVACGVIDAVPSCCWAWRGAPLLAGLSAHALARGAVVPGGVSAVPRGGADSWSYEHRARLRAAPGVLGLVAQRCGHAP